MWTFNESTYVPLSPTNLACYHDNKLSLFDMRNFQEISTPYTFFKQIRFLPPNFLVFVGGSPALSFELMALDIHSSHLFPIKQLPTPNISDYISVPETITFPSENSVAYGYFYPPKNPKFSCNDLPPLRLLSHGGPTASCNNVLNLAILYWTSRGFAVMNVNYGGSTGYGRNYRNELSKNWGIVDVRDCCNAALFLASQKKVDREKLCIQGGSAGGYTTLSCLAFRPDVFKGGCSIFGVADLALLAKDTHKFESRYLESLVEEVNYWERSPINHVEKISCPCIFFQGREDKVVPPEQSERMVECLKKRGIAVSYVEYEGEGHGEKKVRMGSDFVGFRVAEHVKRTLELEIWFYGKILGFEPADKIEPVEIYNKI
jgi:dipeptidyl aminopeptidase/acylaminoacyl peptidase